MAKCIGPKWIVGKNDWQKMVSAFQVRGGLKERLKGEGREGGEGRGLGEREEEGLPYWTMI